MASKNRRNCLDHVIFLYILGSVAYGWFFTLNAKYLITCLITFVLCLLPETGERKTVWLSKKADDLAIFSHRWVFGHPMAVV